MQQQDLLMSRDKRQNFPAELLNVNMEWFSNPCLYDNYLLKGEKQLFRNQDRTAKLLLTAITFAF